MTLRSVAGRRKGEDASDLQDWLRGLQGCPSVDRTMPGVCSNPVHGDDLATWFYVEADRAEGIARRRCLACGVTASLLDSEARWNYPTMWACPNCSQSIAEVAFGLHVEDGLVTWLVMGLRCVECGCVDGGTDLLLAGRDLDEVTASL